MVVSCAAAEELNADIAQMAAKIDQVLWPVLSTQGWCGQTLTFASYELCSVDPVPQAGRISPPKWQVYV